MDGIPAAAAERIQQQNLEQENANQRVYADDAQHQKSLESQRALYGALGGAVSQIANTYGGILANKLKAKTDLNKLAVEHGFKLDELHQSALDKADLYESIINGKASVADLNAASRERIAGINAGSRENVAGINAGSKVSVQGMKNQGAIDKLGAADTYKQNSLLNTAESAKSVRDHMLESNPALKDHPAFQLFSSAVDGGDPSIIKEAGKGLFGSIRAEVLQSQKAHAASELQGQKDAGAMQRVQAQTAGKKTPNQTSKEREYGNLRAQDLMNDVQRDPMTGKPMLGPDKKTPLLNRGAQAELNRRMNAKKQIEQALQQGGPAAAYQAAQKLGITAEQLDELEGN